MNQSGPDSPRAINRVIFFGGTFDPPHLGHLSVIRDLRAHTGRPLTVVPTGIPGHRPRPEASPLQRADMVESAVKSLSDDLVSVCRWEVSQAGPSFTIDTVERWLSQRPDLELDLAVGADVAAGLPTWKSVTRLLEEVRLLVFERQGAQERGPSVLAELGRLGLPVAGAEIVRVSAPAIDGTAIRSRLARGDSCAELLPQGVGEYIRAHRLYASGASADPSSGEG